nr:heterogeneous nuclear ribonucleoprotein U-like protein 1 [Ipomoea batatas]
MLSEKRDFPITGQTPKGKKAKLDVDGGPSSQPSLSIPRFVALNPADCDLGNFFRELIHLTHCLCPMRLGLVAWRNFEIGFNGLLGSALHEKGFAYCWSGARVNAGIKGGKYCFGCKIISEQRVIMEDTPPAERHECRIGVSRGDNPVGKLGESLQSFGFGGNGKFSSAGKFGNYGESFGVGDTILCCIDLESKPASIGFFKNGKWMGMAMQFEVVDSPIKQRVWESAFFPHVLLKNVVVNLQFSLEDGLECVEGYKPWSSTIEDGKALPGPTFSEVHDCEVIMMVGLPDSGKTTWTENWAQEHPEKRYIVLGRKLIWDKMKVPAGLLYDYGERFERLMMESATEMFNALLTMASKLPRNLILDQTNVNKNARKRKLKPFLDYKKIAVVMFPALKELKCRAVKRVRVMGEEQVTDEEVNKMLGSSYYMHGLE